MSMWETKTQHYVHLSTAAMKTSADVTGRARLGAIGYAFGFGSQARWKCVGFGGGT
jgi:hypothetical protein